VIAAPQRGLAPSEANGKPADDAAAMTMDLLPSGPAAAAVDARTADQPLSSAVGAAGEARPTRRRGRRILAIVLGVAVVAVGSIVGVLVTSQPGSVAGQPGSGAARLRLKLPATLTDPGTQGLNSVALSPDDAMLAAADNDGSVYLWNLATGTVSTTLVGSSGISVISVAFGSNGAALVFGDHNGIIYLRRIS
jgi:hypothetical protein